MNRTIVKNSSYLFLAQLSVKIISFFYTLFIARSLSVDDFGLYAVALSYFSLFASLADFGISRFLIREIAKGILPVGSLLSATLVFRVGLVSIFFVISSFLMYLLDPVGARANLVVLALIAVIPQAVALTFDSIFVAYEKLKFSSIGLLVLSIATVFSGFILVSIGMSSMGAVLSLIIGEAIYALFMWFLVLRERISIKVGLDKKLLREIAIGSLPYGIVGILGLLYFKIDTILLSYLKGSYDTGIYSAAYKFLEAVIFIPSAISTALFPSLVRLHETDINQVKKYYYKSMLFLGSLSIIITIGFLSILPIIINSYLPEYVLSITVINILAFTIPFMFIHVPGALVLLATDKYLKHIIYLSIFTLSFNILLNLFLIPPFGYLGSAVVTVLSEILSFLVFFTYLQLRVFKK